MHSGAELAHADQHPRDGVCHNRFLAPGRAVHVQVSTSEGKRRALSGINFLEAHYKFNGQTIRTGNVANLIQLQSPG